MSPVAGIDETSVRALAKLEQVLPARLRHRVGALQHFSESLDRGWGDEPTIEPADLTEIAGACRDTVRLRFDYERRDGESGGRMVEPHRLVSTGRRWYLVAWDVGREDWRTFRVDRMQEPKALTRPFEARELPDGVDAAAFVAAGLQSAWAPAEAVLTLAAPLDEVAAWRPMAGMSLEAVAADRCRLVLRADSFQWLAVNVALVPFPIVDLAPDEVRHEIDAMATRLTTALAGLRECSTDTERGTSA